MTFTLDHTSLLPTLPPKPDSDLPAPGARRRPDYTVHAGQFRAGQSEARADHQEGRTAVLDALELEARRRSGIPAPFNFHDDLRALGVAVERAGDPGLAARLEAAILGGNAFVELHAVDRDAEMRARTSASASARQRYRDLGTLCRRVARYY